MIEKVGATPIALIISWNKEKGKREFQKKIIMIIITTFFWQLYKTQKIHLKSSKYQSCVKICNQSVIYDHDFINKIVKIEFVPFDRNNKLLLVLRMRYFVIKHFVNIKLIKIRVYSWKKILYLFIMIYLYYNIKNICAWKTNMEKVIQEPLLYLNNVNYMYFLTNIKHLLTNDRETVLVSSVCSSVLIKK